MSGVVVVVAGGGGWRRARLRQWAVAGEWGEGGGSRGLGRGLQRAEEACNGIFRILFIYLFI